MFWKRSKIIFKTRGSFQEIIDYLITTTTHALPSHKDKKWENKETDYDVYGVCLLEP